MIYFGDDESKPESAEGEAPAEETPAEPEAPAEPANPDPAPAAASAESGGTKPYDGERGV